MLETLPNCLKKEFLFVYILSMQSGWYLILFMVFILQILVTKDLLPITWEVKRKKKKKGEKHESVL